MCQMVLCTFFSEFRMLFEEKWNKDGMYTGTENVLSLLGTEPEWVVYLSILNNVVKQFPSRNIFHHHEDICRCADHLIPAEYTGMSYEHMLKLYTNDKQQ